VWAALGLVTIKPQSLKGVEVHEVEVAALDQRIDNEGKPPRFRDAI
jgi:hypothetical protein